MEGDRKRRWSFETEMSNQAGCYWKATMTTLICIDKYALTLEKMGCIKNHKPVFIYHINLEYTVKYLIE